MKTTNRPTSTTRLQPNDLATLDAIVRSLWASEPQFHHEQRHDIVSELLAVETDIQRLLLRQASDTLIEDDNADALDCARRLLDLEQRWMGESTQPDVLTEAFP